MKAFRALIAITVMLFVIGINTSAVDKVESKENVFIGYDYLEQFVGTWSGTALIWEAPGAEPTSNPYVTTSKMILGGNYLESKITGDFMGMPVELTQTTGYDSTTGKYTSQLITNITNVLCISEGILDETGRTRTDITNNRECPICPDNEFEMRTVTTLIDHDHYSIDQYMKVGTSEEYKIMEITYTRSR